VGHSPEIPPENPISKSKNEYDILKEVIKFSNLTNKSPYQVDKLFWLVDSGNFYLDKLKIKTNRDEFIEHIKQKYRDIRHFIIYASLLH